MSLISIIDSNTLNSFTHTQTNNVAEYFKFSRPKRFKAYSSGDIRRLAKFITKINPNIRGIIVIDEQGNRAKIKVRNNTHKTNLNYITRCIINNDVDALSKQNSKCDRMILLITKQLNEYIIELNNSYNKYCKIRTKKTFAEKIKYTSIPIAMFALRDGRIDGFFQLHKVIRPSYLLRLIKEKNPEKFNLALNSMRGSDVKTESNFL